MEYEESTSKEIDAAKINDLRRSVGWVERDVDKWKVILSRSSFVYTIWEGDRLAGMGRLVEDGVTGVAYDVAVRNEYQGRGLGRQIVQRLTEEAAARGCSSIRLFMEERGGPRLVSFYKSLGFAKVNTGMRRSLR